MCEVSLSLSLPPSLSPSLSLLLPPQPLSHFLSRSRVHALFSTGVIAHCVGSKVSGGYTGMHCFAEIKLICRRMIKNVANGCHQGRHKSLERDKCLCQCMIHTGIILMLKSLALTGRLSIWKRKDQKTKDSEGRKLNAFCKWLQTGKYNVANVTCR